MRCGYPGTDRCSGANLPVIAETHRDGRVARVEAAAFEDGMLDSRTRREVIAGAERELSAEMRTGAILPPGDRQEIAAWKKELRRHNRASWKWNVRQAEIRVSSWPPLS